MHFLKFISFSIRKVRTNELFTHQIFQRWASTSGQIQQETNMGPLHGVRILDLSRILAGPFASMVLSDLGAEIIKVEKPGSGDDTRSWTPPSINNQSCYFVSVNRNKKSISVDMKHTSGQAILHKLVEKSDVLIENFVPGTLDKFNLGFNSVRQINPKLIYCSITGYGSSGPYKNRGGYDVIAASIGGLLHITGPRNGEPCKVGVAMTDLATGLYAHGAIMAALLQRTKTGLGQQIECNLLSTQLSCLVNLASNYLNAGIEAQRLGTAHESIVPYQSFQTKDERWLTIGTGNNELFFELCDVVQLSSLKSDERFSSNSMRVKHRIKLIEIISNTIRSKTCKEWIEKFEGCKFPYGPVNDIHGAFNDPQIKHNKIIKSIGTMKFVGPAVVFSSSGNFIRSAPPSLGEHTRNVLKSLLNYTDSEIDGFYKLSIIQ